MTQPTLFAAAFNKAQLLGAIGIIVDRDGIRHAEALGLADADTGAAMQVDTLCQIASMTKALVSLGVMQLVEAGRLDLDADVGVLLPDLANPCVLTGFDAAGQPQTRPAARPITLRHLLTHTSGFGYPFVQGELLQYYVATGQPAQGSLASIRFPLLFDPGDDWAYGVSTDWAGLAIEAATGSRLGDYLTEHLFAPLAMNATAFRPALPEGAARVHARLPGGEFITLPLYFGGGEFDAGGGGLTSTAPDYARFIRMVLNSGTLEGKRVLEPGTIAEMARNQIGNLRGGHFGTTMPDLASPFDAFPEQHTGWTLGYATNPETGPNGRAPGSLAWAGIFNSYYWIDPASGVGGVFMSQLAPFGDPAALECFGALERMAYA
jgi:methyl acetate hydrolase